MIISRFTKLAPIMKNRLIFYLQLNSEAVTIAEVSGRAPTQSQSIFRSTTHALIGQYDDKQLGDLIGYLPQDVILLPGTIADNIARMDAQPDDFDVQKAAQRAGVHDLIKSLPEGYNTVLEDAGSNLSGGQRQRIALARAFYGNPLIYVLDEPNSALDSDGVNALNSAIHDIARSGGIVVLMTHRPTAITHCTKLLILRDGQMVAYGPKDEVLKKHINRSKAAGTVGAEVSA